MTLRLILMLALAAILASQSAAADPNKHGKGGHGKGHGKAVEHGGINVPMPGASISLTFDLRERETILSYFAGRPAVVPARGLPPGIAKQVARGRPLPPGIAKQVLPGDLIARLPVRDSRYARIVVGNDILLIDVSANLVLDVIRDVFG